MLSRLFTKRMLIIFLMGFSSGLPLLLTGSTLRMRLSDAGIDLTTIGALSLVGLPYSLKFLWSPLLDRYQLFQLFGRRRSWLIVVQALLGFALCALALSDDSLVMIGGLCLLVAFLSATQDILIDAYRREILPDEELGLGSSLAVNGYRVALLYSGGIALVMADHMTWNQVYLLMALSVGIGIVTTLFCDEPQVVLSHKKSLKQAFLDPFLEMFKRPGVWTLLLFIVLYKIGDSMASDMTGLYFKDLGFTKTEIGTVAKLFGFWATIIGGFVGGFAIIKLKTYRALWIFGILQAVSILSFTALYFVEHSVSFLALSITFENLTSGMGTAAYAGFIAGLTDRRFTATQYALLTSLTGIPRIFASAPTGYLATHLGWPLYFVFCTLAALPGLFLILKIKDNAC